MTETSMFYMIPLVMFMLMLVTKSYRKSLTNTVSITALTVSGYVYQSNPLYAFLIMALSIFFMQIRAIANHNEDRWIKR